MKTKWLFALILLSLVLSACGDPQPGPRDPDVELQQQPEQIAEANFPELEGYIPAYMYEILDPQPGIIIPLAPYLIRFSGHSFGGIEAFEVRVDGSVIGTVAPAGYGSGGPAYGHFFYGELLWTPTGYGDYLIAVRAKASGYGMYSDSLEVQVTVGASAQIAESGDHAELAFLPNCGPEDLTPPSLISPIHYAYTGSTLTGASLPADAFQWANTSGCIPELFRILISPDPEYGWARMGYSDDGFHTTWPPADAEWPQASLDPATMYYWTVNAWTDGVHGPDSEMRVFFTGPICTSISELVAPVLVSPYDGDVYSSTIRKLRYEPGQPECLPDAYYVDLQTDSNFGGTSLVGATSSPTTYVITPELESCTRYYWRVAAMKNQSTGPFSETRSFFITSEDLLCAGQASFPIIKALKDQQCLQGPDPQKYPVLGYLLTGETASIVAQDIGDEWWVIENPDGNDYCYVRKVDNQESGETSDVSKWNDPEIEDEPPLVCSEDLNEQQCIAAGGTWMDTVVRAPYCECE